MGVRRTLVLLTVLVVAALAQGQQRDTTDPQSGSIVGIVVDAQDALIPNATVQIRGDSSADRSVKTNGVGAFAISDLPSGAPLHLTIKASGFGDWNSDATLTPGQMLDLGNIKLVVAATISEVAAASPEKVAVQQVELAERQRLFGILPNFYVTYDTRFVPMTPKLKFQLAGRTATDAATFLGVAVLAGINQASDVAPHYQQGALGYAKRYGAAYTSTVTDIALGSAIFPVLFKQDPRYFYQGTGTKKSRLLHAISAPIITKADNGNWQMNISSLGGDFASSALTNLYYPPSDRGASHIARTFLQISGVRVLNGVLQEFVYRKLTTNSGQPHHHHK
jgi:hypothetical protein